MLESKFHDLSMVNRKLEILEGDSIYVKDTHEHHQKVMELEQQAKMIYQDISEALQKQETEPVKKKVTFLHLLKKPLVEEKSMMLDESLKNKLDKLMRVNENIIGRMYAHVKGPLCKVPLQSNLALESPIWVHDR